MAGERLALKLLVVSLPHSNARYARACMSQRSGYRCASRYRDPYSGNEKGSVENAVGFIWRNLLVPVPSVGALEELNVTVDGREYVAGPAWHSRELLNLPRFH